MLDVAPIAGDVQQGSMETPLDVATENLFNQIRSGQFVVTVPHKPNVSIVTGQFRELLLLVKVRESLLGIIKI